MSLEWNVLWPLKAKEGPDQYSGSESDEDFTSTITASMSYFTCKYSFHQTLIADQALSS